MAISVRFRSVLAVVGFGLDARFDQALSGRGLGRAVEAALAHRGFLQTIAPYSTPPCNAAGPIWI